MMPPVEDDYELKLRALREQIDQADKALLAALNARAAVSISIGELKRGAGMKVHDPAREEMLLAQLEKINPGPLSGEQLRVVYKEILRASRELQK